jgi:HD-like signal output (HDOD) protein
MKFLSPVRYAKLKSSGCLPSPKGLTLAIIRILQRDDYDIDELVRLVKSDPVIAGELIKFSNSALLAQRVPIVSLSQAVMTLGTRQVSMIVMAASIINNLRTGSCPQFNYEKFWSRSLASAISAQLLAPYAKINADENFTAGLLCSLGELALASIFPESYGEILAASENNIPQRSTLEIRSYGNDHRELNASMLLEWGLPLELVSAIYYSELPELADFDEGSRIFGLTYSLHTALAIADICVGDENDRLAMLPKLYSSAAKLGIGTDKVNRLTDKIIQQWQEWGEQLKIQTREIEPFS